MNTSPRLPRPLLARPDRRRFLRGAGVAMALPALSAFQPSRASAAKATPRRMLAICNNLAVLPEKLFPEKAGRDYELTPYLELVKDHRADFTVISGTWHPDVDGGHPADNCFLTAAPHPGSGGFRNTISLDQYAAQYIGHLTRFPSMTLGVNQSSGQRSLSWTAGGVLIPCEDRPSAVYSRMFLRGDPDQVKAQIRRLELGRSVMDAVGEQAKALSKSLGARDRERLDQYFTSARDLEARLAKAREWEDVPLPKTKAPMPKDFDSTREFMQKTSLMYDIARLAFESDSTRLIALLLDGVSTPAFEVNGMQMKDGYHNLSHHGKAPDKLEQLDVIDREHMKLLDRLLRGLKETKEDGATLLDRTMVLYGSNLGDAHMHTTTNLPVFFAGGGFKHGQHLAFDRQKNYPLPNLFVSMLQRLGIETDKFASSTGTMRGLEMA